MVNEYVRVGCYIRVSTQEQAKEGYSIGAQTEKLKNYCVARGWIASEIYTDPGYSGAKMERRALQKLISDVKQKRIDLVLVYKLDRLSRSQKDTLYLIEDVFIKNNIDFVSINENFDTSTPFGRAMIGILSVFAQLEREQIKERTKMGRVERAKQGLWRGGGNVPIGYTYLESKNELVIDDYEAMQVREVFDLYANKHYALTKISAIMNEKGYKHKHGDWSYTSTIRKLLANKIYISIMTWEGEEYKGQHQPIISEDLFYTTQKRLNETGWKKGTSAKKSPFVATTLLSGIVFCKNCGGRYYGSGTYRGSKKLPCNQRDYIHIYMCYSRAKTKKEMIKDPTCKNKNWRAEILDNYITKTILDLNLKDKFNALASQSSAVENTNEKKQTLLKRINVLESQISKTLDLLEYDNLPTYKVAERLESLSKEKSALELSLKDLKNSEENNMNISPSEAKKVIKNASNIFKTGTLEQKRELVQTLIKRIEIMENDISIEWNFI